MTDRPNLNELLPFIMPHNLFMNDAAFENAHPKFWGRCCKKKHINHKRRGLQLRRKHRRAK